jgi:hypothetical protein
MQAFFLFTHIGYLSINLYAYVCVNFQTMKKNMTSI